MCIRDRDATYRILVVTDWGNTVYEASNESNNTTVSSPFSITHADLTAAIVASPATAVSASTITVKWQITNSGSGTAAGQWTDRLYLSTDNTVSSDDLILASTPHTGALLAGAFYSTEVNVLIPIETQGARFRIVQTDVTNQVKEFNAETNNNSPPVSLNVSLAPYADLSVSNVIAPTRTIDDPARITVTWTVSNIGTGAGLTPTWFDSIVASSDAIAGNGDDILLAEYANPAGLTAGIRRTIHTVCHHRFSQGRLREFFGVEQCRVILRVL